MFHNQRARHLGTLADLDHLLKSDDIRTMALDPRFYHAIAGPAQPAVTGVGAGAGILPQGIGLGLGLGGTVGGAGRGSTPSSLTASPGSGSVNGVSAALQPPPVVFRSTASSPSLRARESATKLNRRAAANSSIVSSATAATHASHGSHSGRGKDRSAGNVKVVVRVRQFLPRELKCKAPCLISMDPASQTTTIQHPDTLRHGHAASKQSLRGDDGARTFTFDRSLWSHDPDDPSYASQEDVYAALGEEFLDHNFEGYHTCIFAYGQTGAGKSYTMMGTPDQPGLIPRTCQDLFERIADGAEQHPHVTYAVRVSYFEVYNEHVRDLLAPGGSSGGSGGGGGAAGAGSTCYLKVRESPTDGPYVKDLTEIPVRSLPEIMRCIRKGDAARTTASTKMNDTSSRSHAVFTVTLKQIQHDLATDETTERTARIRLVDLAGSERAKATEATGERLREGSNINRSLATLGRVMKALATSSSSRPSSPSKQHRKAKDAVVPYRDSVLTYLLKDSLGGNSKTAMIACISPADYEETLSTLRYADQAKRIRTRAVVNQDHLSAAERDAQIAEMAETIRLLQLSLGRVSASAQVVAQQQQDSRLAIEREREREVQVERLEEYQSQVAKLQQLMEEKEMIAASKIRQLTTENEALRLHLKLAVESLKNPIPQVPVQGGDQVDAAYPEEDAEECDEDGGEGDENGAGGEWDDHTDADTAEQDDESDILEMQSQLQDLLDQVTFFKNKVQDDHERFGLRARDPKDESDITAMLDLTNDTDIASLGDVTVLCSDVGQATRDETLTAAPEPSRVETAAGEVFANA